MKRTSTTKYLRERESPRNKALRTLSANKNTKMTDGGGKPYSVKRVWSSRKADKRVEKDMKIWREHAN